MINPENELTLHSLWEDLSAVVLRRKTEVLLVALTVTVAVYVGLLFVSDQFEARASLLVKIGRENAQVPVSVEKGGIFPSGVQKEEINSYIALLTSRPLIQATVKEIGVARFHPELPRPESLLGWVKYGLKKAFRWTKDQLDELQILLALKRRLSQEELACLALEHNLKVEREKDADVIGLALRLPDPTLACDVLQSLIRGYLSRHMAVVLGDRPAAQVFDNEARSYGDSLLALREKVAQLKSDLGVTSVTEQKTQELEMLKAAELGRQEAERERSRIQAEMKELNRRRDGLDELQLTSKSMSSSAARSAIRQSLAEANLERTFALSKYQPESEAVQKADTRIASLESALPRTTEEEVVARTLGRNPILSLVESRLAEDEIRAQGLVAVVEKTDSQMAAIKTELRRLDQAEAELQKLQLEIKIAESRFVDNATRREEARGQENLDRWQVANVIPFTPASYSDKPVAPKRLLIMLLGLAGGLVAGISLALFVEWRGEVVYCPRDLDRLDPGIWLGSFPSSPEDSQRANPPQRVAFEISAPGRSL